MLVMDQLKAEEKLETVFTLNASNIKDTVETATGNKKLASNFENQYLMRDLAQSEATRKVR